MTSPFKEGNGIRLGNNGIVKIDNVNSVKIEVRSDELGGKRADLSESFGKVGAG